MVLLEIRCPVGNGSDLAFDRKQEGTQHVGRESWFRSEYGIAVLHHIIDRRQFQGPELFHALPGRRNKRSQPYGTCPRSHYPSESSAVLRFHRCRYAARPARRRGRRVTALQKAPFDDFKRSLFEGFLQCTEILICVILYRKQGQSRAYLV